MADTVDPARLMDALQHRLAAQGPTERIQTHISTVLLCGNQAYKFKRPVQLPFLDFRTPAQRRHFLLEELRLNQRTAPGLYLEVVPVTGSVDQPQLGGSGPVMDWALHMHRFDRAGEWSHLAAHQGLSAADIDALADHLVAFHASLPPIPPDAEVADTATWAEASFDELRPPGSALLVPWRAPLLKALQAADPSPAERRTAGWVRECHGDLHLANIVRWQGQVMAFDALEFDARLRHIDVMADLSFAFMDLCAHGLPALAWRLVNRHVEASGDFEGLRLLRAFSAYRALVRAKVAQLDAAPANPSSDQAPARFQRYAALMPGLLAPPRPLLVLCMGFSGSGKSTLALMLAERLGAMRVRSDVERKRLLGPAPPEVLYNPEATQRTYERLGAIAQRLLSAQVSVVVDAAALRQHERAALQQVAQGCGAPFVVVRCQAPEALMRKRIQTRAALGLDPSDATPAVLDLQLQIAEPLPEDWARFTHMVDNRADPDALQAHATALVARWRESYHTALPPPPPPTPASTNGPGQ